MEDYATDRNKFKKLFSNTTSRILLGIWILMKGSQFPLKLIMEILSLSEDALETKLQTFAGMGLVHVTTNAEGERNIDFLRSPGTDLEKMILEFFEGRKTDFAAIELKVHSLLYKAILTSHL